MILKKAIAGIFFLTFLNGCVQNTALLGTVYTFGASGNVYQTGLSYGSSKLVTNLTGKSPGENVKSLLMPNKEDTEFEKLVKKRITETRKKFNLSNQ